MDLTAASTSALARLLAALEAEQLAFPLSRLALAASGLESLGPLAGLSSTVGRAGLLALLRAVLAERRAAGAAPELVWTGPDGRRSGARDTRVVLAELFGRAQSRVLIAGFAFDHASDVLGPLHAALVRGASARVFADSEVARTFLTSHWPFGPPFPEVFAFLPEDGVFASLHAKCVVVDGRWTFVTSANFTDRGQTRNVEVGVLLDDLAFAEALESQFGVEHTFSRVET